MKTCINPQCIASECIASNNEFRASDKNVVDENLDVCAACGHRSCEHCGSHFDIKTRITDRCPYCEDGGRIDCDDRTCDLEFCRGCGDPCSRLDDFEEELERQRIEAHQDAVYFERSFY